MKKKNRKGQNKPKEKHIKIDANTDTCVYIEIPLKPPNKKYNMHTNDCKVKIKFLRKHFEKRKFQIFYCVHSMLAFCCWA